MSKKFLPLILLLCITLSLGGCSLLNQLSGKNRIMLDYLEDTYDTIDEYLSLIEVSNSMQEWEEWEEFTKNEFLPKMDTLLSSLYDVKDGIKNEELLAIHQLLLESVEKEVAGHRAWLEEDYDKAEELWTDSDKLHRQHDNEIDALAKSWGVTIDWE